MKKDLATSACIILFSCALYAQAAKLPPPRFEALGPAFLPKIVIGALIALCLLDMLLTCFRRRRAGAEANAPSAVPAEKPGLLPGVVLPVVTVVYFAVYVLLMSHTDLPYLPLTFAYILLGSWTLAFFRLRALPAILGTAMGVTGLIYFVFSVCLETILP